MKENVFNTKTDGKTLIWCLCAAGMYFLADPTLEWTYPLYCTYRVQTLVGLARNLILAVVFAVWIYTLFQSEKKGKDISWGIIVPYCGVYLGYLVSCILNTGTEQLSHWADALFTSLVPILLVGLLVSDEKKKNTFLHVLSICYLCLAAMNLLFYFCPQLYFGEAKEWREVFFLGSKNRAGWPLMIGLFFSLLNNQINGKKAELICYCILLLGNVLIIKSMTTVLGVLVISFFLLIPFIRKKMETLHFGIFIALTVLAFVLLMWFLLPITQSKPVAAVLSMMGKDPGLSDRYVLWETGVEMIKEHPVFGTGFHESSGFIPHTNPYGTTYHHAHNEILQTLYEGGLFTALLALAMLLFTAVKLEKSSSRTVGAIGKIIIFAFLIMLQADLIPYYCWYMVAFLCNTAVILSEQESSLRTAESTTHHLNPVGF